MCIAIAVPIGFIDSLDKYILRRCHSNHPHGMGFAYVDNEDKVRVETFMHFKKFWRSFKDARENFKESPFIIHFRKNSKGITDLSNCHPFAISDRQAFIHNGTIWRIPDDPKKTKSDTFLFNEKLLRYLPENWDKNEGIVELVKEYITERSKLVILNSDKTYSIIHESKGEWHNNIWWSNDSYKTDYYPVVVNRAGFNTGQVARQDLSRKHIVDGDDGSEIKYSRNFWDEKDKKYKIEIHYKDGQVEIKDNQYFGESSFDSHTKKTSVDDYIECEFCGTCMDVGGQKILHWQVNHVVCPTCYEELSDEATFDKRNFI
jgi:predicted glutamine amidotransferase